MKILLLTIGLLLCAPGAWATCPNPLTIKDASGTTQNLSTLNDGSGNCQTNIVPRLDVANGWTPKLLAGLTTTVTSVKSGAGWLGAIQCFNPNTVQSYVQIFNIASGSVTLGSSTPLLSVPVGPSATGGFALSDPGVTFSTAISVAVTTTATGSTAPITAMDCNALYN